MLESPRKGSEIAAAVQAVAEQDDKKFYPGGAHHFGQVVGYYGRSLYVVCSLDSEKTQWTSPYNRLYVSSCPPGASATDNDTSEQAREAVLSFGRQLEDHLSGANKDMAPHTTRVPSVPRVLLLRYVTADSLEEIIDKALEQGREALGGKVRIVRFGPKDAQNTTEGAPKETKWAICCEPESVVSQIDTVDLYYVTEIVVAAVEGAEPVQG